MALVKRKKRVLVAAHYRNYGDDVETVEAAELPPSTLRWEAAEHIKSANDPDRLRDLERIVLEHRRWLQKRREEDGVVYTLDANGELQISMAPEFADKISDAFEAGEIVEYPAGDARGIFHFEGGEGRVFGWKERPQS